jgi:cell division transport system permease protein
MGHNRFSFFLTEASRSLRNNFATTLAAVVTVLVVLFLMGVGAALGSYMISFTSNAKHDVTIKIWLADNSTIAQRNSIDHMLRNDSRIDPKSVRYFTKDDAYQEARKKYGPELAALGSVNPFQARFEVKAKNPDNTAAVALALGGTPGLLASDPAHGLPNPDYGSTYSDRVIHTAGVIEAVIATVAIVLAIAAVLLIGNTIRLSIFARRREVEVMKLVGATNWFVRWPFMFEGMICGLIGSIGAVVALFISYEALSGWLHGDSASTTSSATALAFWQIALLLVVAGIGLGAAGSGLTMRKFLRV